MNPSTNWLKQTRTSGGLDHLGSQAPCINLYGRLLPGITNVTDRGRYYSFYPWFFWAYEKQYPNLVWDEIVERFRRADCLFTLIAERHAQKLGDDNYLHGIAMVGRSTLVEPLRNLTKGESLKLSKYATQEPGNTDRYFKNKLGGLGQYYMGTFVELGLVDLISKKKVVNYTLERGEGIASAFDSGVNRRLFFETIDNDKVDHQVLDQLSPFCPCQLSKNPDEHKALIDLFFDRNNLYDERGKQRRLTLSLLLNLINEFNKNNMDFDQFAFRGVVYTGFLPDQLEWDIHESLIPTQKLWQTYQRNELLSIALQGLFWMALNVLLKTDPKPRTSGEFVSQLIENDFIKDALAGNEAVVFEDAVNKIREELPPIDLWQDSSHEIEIAKTIKRMKNIKNKTKAYTETIKASLQIILLLAARNDQNSNAYANLKYPDGYFDYYPINLYSFQSNLYKIWQKMTLKELLAWLLHKWGIEAHIKIALRKLRHSSKNTFRVYPTEEGLKVNDSIPEPVFTTPRFQQAVQVLRDIDAIYKSDDTARFKLKPLGKSLLDEAIGN